MNLPQKQLSAYFKFHREMYLHSILFIHVTYVYKIVSNTELASREVSWWNKGLDSWEPLVITFSLANQEISFFDVCLCFKSPY
jgi:hypothetical protein